MTESGNTFWCVSPGSPVMRRLLLISILIQCSVHRTDTWPNVRVAGLCVFPQQWYVALAATARHGSTTVSEVSSDGASHSKYHQNLSKSFQREQSMSGDGARIGSGD